jgi:hypothetical protein
MLRTFALFAVLLAATASGTLARVYELRTYHCNDGKLDALKARFRNHTVRIFARHGIESIGYWVPRDPEKARNTLIYLVSHPSREEAEKHWQEFRTDPEWVKVRADSETGGKLVQKVDSEFLDPTDFSPLK